MRLDKLTTKFQQALADAQSLAVVVQHHIHHLPSGEQAGHVDYTHASHGQHFCCQLQASAASLSEKQRFRAAVAGDLIRGLQQGGCNFGQ